MQRAVPGSHSDGGVPGFASAVAFLVAEVERILNESADPEVARTFDAAGWVAAFVSAPHPALGGRPPAALMDTTDGRAAVRQLIAQQQSGAYA